MMARSRKQGKRGWRQTLPHQLSSVVFAESNYCDGSIQGQGLRMTVYCNGLTQTVQALEAHSRVNPSSSSSAYTSPP